jgi:GxxExxY protein
MEGLVMLESEQLTYTIRGCVYEVYRRLGCGFLEKVYERALQLELGLQGLQVENQVPLQVSYKGVVVGEYYADLVVNQTIILELKAQQKIPPSCEAQLLNYLKAAGLRTGLLANFTFPKATIKRIVL